MIILRCINDN